MSSHLRKGTDNATEEMAAKLATTVMIKPSSPTPENKKCVKFSVLDQAMPILYLGLIYFYRGESMAIALGESVQRRRRAILKSSLSEILVNFYPFAGRINGNVSIQCSDVGVPYREVDFDYCLQEVLAKHGDASVFKQLFPVKIQLEEEFNRVPLLAQASFFKCGGIAISVLMSHKLADAAVMTTFIRSWAKTAAASGPINDKAELQLQLQVDAPDFNIPSSLYPPSDLLNSVSLESNFTAENCIFNTYVFDTFSIAALQAKAREGSRSPDFQPTRVEAVSALIWKCAMKASAAVGSKYSSSVLIKAVNMRKRHTPPLPENTPGNNVISIFPVCNHVGSQDQISLRGLVGLLKAGLKDFSDNFMKKIQCGGEVTSSAILQSHQELGKLVIQNDEIDVYGFTSLCGFKMYDADFGWGKPDWASVRSGVSKNMVLLTDTKEGDGIEALVVLERQQMAAFEQDPELLWFAKPLRPSLINSRI